MSAFKAYRGELEARFGMFSVCMDEAIGLHDGGFVVKALEMAVLTGSLCGRFTERLEGVLSSIEKHATDHGTTPSVEPVDAADFRSPWGRRSATASSLRSVALLSQHGRFISKVRTLRAMVHHMGCDICASAEYLSSNGIAGKPGPVWSMFAQEYFDLNTCYRESLIALKCFLRVLPDAELPTFQRTLSIPGVVQRLQPSAANFGSLQ